jgi:hypothetical protein
LEPIEIHAKQTSNWGLLIGSLIFLFCSVYLYLNANQVNSPSMAKIISGILFVPSIILLLFSANKLRKKQLVLLIDKRGIVFHPSANLNYMEWKNIAEIEDLKLPRQRVINIKLVESDLFLQNESNTFLQARMRFWYKMYGAVVSFDANTLNKHHFEILNLFDEFMEDYKTSLTT